MRLIDFLDADDMCSSDVIQLFRNSDEKLIFFGAVSCLPYDFFIAPVKSFSARTDNITFFIEV